MNGILESFLLQRHNVDWCVVMMMVLGLTRRARLICDMLGFGLLAVIPVDGHGVVLGGAGFEGGCRSVSWRLCGLVKGH